MKARRLSLRVLAPVLALVLLFVVAGPSLGTFLGVTSIFSAPENDALLVPNGGCQEYVELAISSLPDGRGDPELEAAIRALPDEVRCFSYLGSNIYASDGDPLAAAYGDRMRWYCELISNPAVPYDAECTPEFVDTGFSPDPNCVTIYDPNVPDRAVGQDCDLYLRALYQQQQDEIQQQIADGYKCQFFTADGKYPDFESWRDGVPGFGPNDPIVTCEPPAALAPTCITPQGGKSWCDQRPTWCDDSAAQGQPGWCSAALTRPSPSPSTTDAVNIIIECLDETEDAPCTASEYSRATGELLRTYPVDRP